LVFHSSPLVSLLNTVGVDRATRRGRRWARQRVFDRDFNPFGTES